MSAELLVATGVTHAKGTIVDVQHGGWTWREHLPNYAHVTISDATKSQVENYMQPWRKEVVLEELADVNGALRFRVKGAVIRAIDSAGGIALSEIQDVLTSLNLTTESDGAGEVVILANVDEVLASSAFWSGENAPLDISPVGARAPDQNFDISYDGTISANEAITRIDFRGGEVRIVGAGGFRCTFRRERIIELLRDDITRVVSGTVLKNRYRFTEAYVDGIVNGADTMTRTEALAVLVDEAA